MFAAAAGASPAADGFNCFSGLLDDFWRLPLTAPAEARWQRLPPPREHGGPGPVHALRGAACDADGLFVVLAAGTLYTFAPGSGSGAGAWRRLGRPWANRREDSDPRVKDEEDADSASLAVHGRFALLYRPAQGLLRVCLRTGAALRLHAPSTAAPQLAWPHLWGSAASDSALRLWGGSDLMRSGPPCVPGAPHAVCPPPSNDMWLFNAGAWARAPRGGGGGVVPPARGESSLVPIPTAGAALLFGGYTELQVQCWPSGGGQLSMNTFRYLNDAYVYREPDAAGDGGGWRALLCEGAPPPAGAQRCAAFDAAQGRVLLFGGYAGEAKFSFARVHVLQLEGVGAAAPPPQCLACGASADELTARGGKLRRCAGCRQVFFCSDACQTAHWSAHKAACKQAREQ
jgi:hypothetical protein